MEFASLQQALRAHRGSLAAVLGFSCVLNLLLLVSPLYMMLVFDHVLTSRSVETLIVLTLMAAGALAFYGVFDVLRAQILNRLAVSLEVGLTPTVLARAIAMGRYTAAATTAQALRDVATLRALVTGGAALALIDAPWAVLFAIALFVLHPLLGLAGVLGGLALLAVAVANEWAARGPSRELQQAAVRAGEWTDVVARHGTAVAAAGMVVGVLREWRERGAALWTRQITAADRAAFAAGSARSLRMLVQIAALALGAELVLHRQIGAGSMVAASLLLGRMLAPLEAGIANGRQFLQGRLAHRRLTQLLAVEGERRPVASQSPPPAALVVDAVAYVPPGSRDPLLRHISFQLKQGEALGILGPAASGKSTLARLLVGGAAPSTGHLSLGGVDLERWQQRGGQRLGYLPQQPFLLPGTVSQNIAGFEEAAAEAVASAAMLVGAHEMILQLPQGYETPVEADGAPLSAGQRQSIALARACFGSPPLLVLDDPTAHLDGIGREAVIGAIASLKEGPAILVVVSRDPAVVNVMDRIALMSRGNIVRLGDRAEVMSALGASPETGRAAAQLVPGTRRFA